MITSVQKIITSHKTLFLALLLFSIIFSALGLFYGHWGMIFDDWGNLYHTTMAQSWKDFERYFINIELASHNGNFTSPFGISPEKQAFFNGLLRPLTFVYYWIEYHIFGLNPFAFFLVSAAFHALSCVILFFIFSAIVPLLWAFLSALFFGFHPSLYIWWGFISPQSYYVELFFLLLIFLCLHNFLRTSRLYWYALSCLLFAHNLLLREQTFFLAFWLIPAFYFYDVLTKKRSKHFLKSIITYLKHASGFFAVTLGYIALRLWLFPLTSNTSTLTFKPTWSSFVGRISERVFDFVTYIANLFALTALPQNHQILKGSLIVGIFSFLTYLYLNNKHRGLILFLAISIPFFSWPALLMHHQPRYTYMSFPFFIFMVLMLCRYYQGPKIRIPRLIPASLLIVFIGINSYMITNYTLMRQERVATVFNAFTELVKQPEIHNRTLCFIDYPPLFSSCIPHAIWLLTNDHTITVYQNKKLHTEQNPLYIAWNYATKKFKILADTQLFEQT